MQRTRRLSLLMILVLLMVSISDAFAHMPASPALPTEGGITPEAAPEVWGTDAFYFRPGLFNDMIVWAAAPNSCAPIGVEFPRPCQINSRPANGGDQRLLHNAGTTGPSIESTIAVDATFIYWIGSDFQIKRLPRGGAPATIPQNLGATAFTTPTLQFDIAVDSNFIFWTESVAGSVGRLYRMPKNGGPRELMRTDSLPMRLLQADGTGGAYYVTTFLSVLVRVSPGPGGFVSDLSGPPGVVSYALDSTHVYWAERISSLNIKRAPRSNLSSETTLEERGNIGTPTAPTIAVDLQNIYWHETRGGVGPIYRRALAGDAPEAITANQTTTLWMASNNRYLFWSGGDIYRLPVNATARTLDLTVQALPMEIIQTIQRPANDVPLVSGKETFVRVYPRILSSVPERDTVRLWPGAVLHGTRGGVALPGSPLQPELRPGRGRVDAVEPDRRDLDSGYWFRLPSSWADGTVQLRAVLNPSRVQAETNFVNNTTSQTVTFTRKSPICLDIRPVSTERGTTISAWSPGVGGFFRRAEELLPTNELRVLMRGGNPLRKPRWYLFESDPFGLSQTNSDSGWMLFLLNLNTAFNGNPCPDGGRTINTVMAQDFPQREVNGMQLGNSQLFFMFIEPAGGFPQNRPGGAITLAHESAHAFGRGHVDCGGPSGVDGGYPYPPCQLDNAGPNEHIGFDPRTRTLLLPNTTGDLMSYAHLLPVPQPRWTSDYTWRAIFNALGNRPAAFDPSSAPIGASAGPAFIVTGFISGNTAELRESFELSDPLLSQVSDNIAASTSPNAGFRMRAFNGPTQIFDQPLRVAEVSDTEIGQPIIPFFQRIDAPSRPTRIEIVRVAGNAVLGSITASPNPPSVAITAPTPGSSFGRSLTIAWTASDPDGGILHHMVRYSADGGTTWTVIDSGLTGTSITLDLAGLPGSSNARVQVITTDGLNTAIATSGAFTTARIGPDVSIVLDTPAVAVQGDMFRLRGRAYDAEDGFLTGSHVQWQVTGQINTTADGEDLTLLNLPPGMYTVQFSGTDSDGNTGTFIINLEVAPKQVRDAAAPTLDGFCDDTAYDTDTDPIVLRNEGTAMETTAQVRLIRNGGFVYACFSGMALDGGAPEVALLKFDPNNSADAQQQASDLIFLMQSDGVARTGRGNGTTSDVFDSLPQGLIGAVSVTENWWSAEMQIDAALLGGWNKLVRIHAAHAGSAAWPRATTVSAPRTWGLSALGNVPTFRVRLPLAVR